jgi:hypothetical protein
MNLYLSLTLILVHYKLWMNIQMNEPHGISICDIWIKTELELTNLNF